jgi:hypothetical protein
MPTETMRIAVLAVRRPPVTRWGTGELRPAEVLTRAPDLAPPARIAGENGTETWYLGARDMVLWTGDTGHHRDNLASDRPSVWVVLRGQRPETAELVCVTVDPYEGEGYAGDPALTVEAVPMPEAVRHRLAGFVAAHHVEMPFKKRKRSPHDPDALQPRAPRILPEAEKWGAGRRKP